MSTKDTSSKDTTPLGPPSTKPLPISIPQPQHPIQTPQFISSLPSPPVTYPPSTTGSLQQKDNPKTSGPPLPLSSSRAQPMDFSSKDEGYSKVTEKEGREKSGYYEKDRPSSRSSNRGPYDRDEYSSTKNQYSSKDSREGDYGYGSRRGTGSRPSSSHSRYSQDDYYSRPEDSYSGKDSYPDKTYDPYDYNRGRSRRDSYHNKDDDYYDDDSRRRRRSRSSDRGEKERRRSPSPTPLKKKTSSSSVRSTTKRDREEPVRPVTDTAPKPADNWQLGEEIFTWSPSREKTVTGKSWRLVEPNWAAMDRDSGYLTTMEVTRGVERELAVEKVKEHVNKLVVEGIVPGTLIYVQINDVGYHLNPHGEAETVHHWTLTFIGSNKTRLNYRGTSKPALDILHVRMEKAAYWARLTEDLGQKKELGYIDKPTLTNALKHLEVMQQSKALRKKK